ncbi:MULTISPECIES: AAA family ATPase [unclassified Pseudoxanthomonas]|uniref:ATP-dependent nuclease n=1 Tax=unclassified Pseudoxanthomonas TaxID=2645906 RepID=UPI00307E5233
MASIEISGLKHIASLNFEIPRPGVHLLAGSNGAGKTTLLACLRRIFDSNSFRRHFATSRQSDQLDRFGAARVTYRLGGNSVTYGYAGERWVPTPRSNSVLLRALGYPEGRYFGATADRITPNPEDFEPRRVRPAAQEIRDAANQIFGTTKFDHLRTINLRPGSGSKAFLIQTAAAPLRAQYYSERNFSLGELCVLKMLRDLQGIPRKSLLLVDELELALHPRVQIALLRYLERIATEQELTVIFSTHSVSLLKAVKRRQIMYLEANGADVATVVGCFPTYALGGIASSEEAAPDVLVYVEDDAAMYISESLVQLTKGALFADEYRLYPTVQVVPVGTFMSVINLVRRGTAMLPDTTRIAMLLDADVKNETVADWVANAKHDKLAVVQEVEDEMNFLPWTPEVGLAEFLKNTTAEAQAALRAKFADHRIHITQELIGALPLQPGKPQRDACKAALGRVIDHIRAVKATQSREHIERQIFEVFAEYYFQHNRNAVLALFAPMIRN